MSTDNKPQNAITVFSGFMDKMKPQMALALPKHLTADRMARLALTAFSTSSALQRCDPKSIAASIMTAGQLGLEPGVNGAGYLIPYGTTCTFVPGWKGLVDLVSRSGRGTVFTGVIFRDQDYTFTDGARRDLVIHNETDLDRPEDITHAYAIGWVKDATMPIIELWRVSKIEKHRATYNKMGTKHYSFRDWEMYCRKVPLLQVLKYMPCSIEMANALEISHASESGRGAIIENGIVIDMDGEVPHTTPAEGISTVRPQAQSFYPQDQFNKNLPKWKKDIAAGKPVDDLIAMIETKFPLTEAQKATLKSNDPSQATTVEASKQAAPLVASDADGVMHTFEQIKGLLENAATLDALADAAALINSVKDAEQKAALTEIYNVRGETLN
jgi:recombination protein RecT